MVTLTGWMLYTVLAVMGAMLLNLLAGIYKAGSSNSLSFSKLPDFLKGMINYILPLMLIAHFIPMDPTGFALQAAYYIGGVGAVIKYLLDIKNKLS